MLIKNQTRIKESMDACVTARPSVKPSLALKRGLDTLQKDFDAKKMLRLRNRVRTSAMISTQF